MGSACCVIARSRDPSITLALQQHWGSSSSNQRRIPYGQEASVASDGDGDNFILHHRLQHNRSSRTFNKRGSRSKDSGSNVFGWTISSQQEQQRNKHLQYQYHQYGGADSSPQVSDNFYFSPRRSSSTSIEVSDPDIVHLERSLQKSGVLPHQEPERLTSFRNIRPVSERFTMNVFKPKKGLPMESQLVSTSSGVSDITSIELELSGQSIRTGGRDDLPSYSIERTVSASNKYAFADLAEMSFPRSSRWSNVDISAAKDVFVSRRSHDGDFFFKSCMEQLPQEYHHPVTHSERRKCGLCSKVTSRKPSSSFSRIPGSKELPVVSVLQCGHIFHAECLDHATPMMHAHDPPCPRCEYENNRLHMEPERKRKCV